MNDIDFNNSSNNNQTRRIRSKSFNSVVKDPISSQSTTSSTNKNADRIRRIISQSKLNSAKSNKKKLEGMNGNVVSSIRRASPAFSNTSSTTSSSLKAPNSYANSNNSQSSLASLSTNSNNASTSSRSNSASGRNSREHPISGVADSKFMLPFRKASLTELNGVGSRSRSTGRDYHERTTSNNKTCLGNHSNGSFIASLGLAPLLDQSGNQLQTNYQSSNRISPTTASFNFPSSEIPPQKKSKNVLSQKTTEEILDSLLGPKLPSDRRTSQPQSTKSKKERSRSNSTPPLPSNIRSRQLQTSPPPLPNALPPRSSTPEHSSSTQFNLQNSPPRSSGPMILCETYTFPKPRIITAPNPNIESNKLKKNVINHHTTFIVGHESKKSLDIKGKGKENLELPLELEDTESQVEEISSVREVWKENEESRLEREDWNRHRSRSESRTSHYRRGSESDGNGSDSDGGRLFRFIGRRRKMSTDEGKKSSIPISTSSSTITHSLNPFTSIINKSKTSESERRPSTSEGLLNSPIPPPPSQIQHKRSFSFNRKPIRRQRSQSHSGINLNSSPPVHPFDALLADTTTRYIGSKPIFHTRQSPSLDTLFPKPYESIDNRIDPVRVPGQAFTARFAVHQMTNRRQEEGIENENKFIPTRRAPDIPTIPSFSSRLNRLASTPIKSSSSPPPLPLRSPGIFDNEATLSILLCDKLEAEKKREESLSSNQSSTTSHQVISLSNVDTSSQVQPTSRSFLSNSSTSRLKQALPPPLPLPLSHTNRSIIAVMNSPLYPSFTSSPSPPSLPPKSPNRSIRTKSSSNLLPDSTFLNAQNQSKNYLEEELGIVSNLNSPKSVQEATTPVTGGSWNSKISERSSVLQMDDNDSFKDLFFHPPLLSSDSNSSEIIYSEMNDPNLEVASPLHEAFFGEIIPKPIKFVNRSIEDEGSRNNSVDEIFTKEENVPYYSSSQMERNNSRKENEEVSSLDRNSINTEEEDGDITIQYIPNPINNTLAPSNQFSTTTTSNSNRSPSSFIDFDLNEKDDNDENNFDSFQGPTSVEGDSFIDFTRDLNDSSTSRPSFLDWSPLQSPILSNNNIFRFTEEGVDGKIEDLDLTTTSTTTTNSTIQGRNISTSKQFATYPQLSTASTDYDPSLLQVIPTSNSQPKLTTIQSNPLNSSSGSIPNNLNEGSPSTLTSSRFNSPRISSWSSHSRFSGIEHFPHPPFNFSNSGELEEL